MICYLESALVFSDYKKNFDPSSCSHVTRVFICKQIVISFGVLFVLKCFSVILSYFLLIFVR